jgi:hypothetical protein
MPRGFRGKPQEWVTENPDETGFFLWKNLWQKNRHHTDVSAI